MECCIGYTKGEIIFCQEGGLLFVVDQKSLGDINFVIDHVDVTIDKNKWNLGSRSEIQGHREEGVGKSCVSFWEDSI